MMLLDKATMLDSCFKADYVSGSHLTTVIDKIIDEEINEEEVNDMLQPQSPEISVEVIDISESQNDPQAKRRKLSRLLDKSRPKEAVSSGSEFIV